MRCEKGTPDDLRILEEWRAAHGHVLNTFQSLLRNRTKDTDIVVAQRHKRKLTIIDKLKRYPKMRLARMDDVAGCRLIFKNLDELYKFRENMLNARFKHKLKNDIDKYDYIKSPKPTGYRGVHDVYSYNVNSPYGERYKGLLIEIQYRTFDQHAWATAVEVVGSITKNQPKFERGDDRFLEIFRFASEIIARAFENRKSCLNELNDKKVVQGFDALDSELMFIRMLDAVQAANKKISEQKNTILMAVQAANKKISEQKNTILMFEDNMPHIISSRHATTALKKLFELERKNPRRDIVFVRADKIEDMRVAFKNYFSDATDFIERTLLGRDKLSGG